MTRSFLLFAVVAAFAFAGCLGSGSLKSNGATLAYDGSENGDHREQTKCDADGKISGSGKVSDGTVHVSVSDGNGTVLWDHTYSGDIQQNQTAITGASGTWTLKAVRASNDLIGDSFKGNYRFILGC